MGMLLGKYIPIDIVAQMPLPFVHCLRDIRLMQLEEQKRRQEILNTQMKHPVNNQNRTNPPPRPNIPSGGFDDSELEDFVEEMAGI